MDARRPGAGVPPAGVAATLPVRDGVAVDTSSGGGERTTGMPVMNDARDAGDGAGGDDGAGRWFVHGIFA